MLNLKIVKLMLSRCRLIFDYLIMLLFLFHLVKHLKYLM